MRTFVRCALLGGWWLLALFVIVGCGTTSKAAAISNITSNHVIQKPVRSTAATLKSVDWANFTYMSTCYDNTQPFHTKSNHATNGVVHFVVYPPKYGDITGNGQLDAVVPYQCSAADAMGVRVFVYSGSAAHPILIGDLPTSNPRGEIANVTSIAISNGDLNLAGTGYAPGTPRCCPDLAITSSYHWNGTSFVLTSFTSKVHKA
ncbi:MAG TPA: hypothetical protein VHZ51_31350 [Ktedonobacteraceae bacterium]|jgi:hypothetical protein|nr:hypothetical protein [Ktedonobacteraceae bacterium]